jgi:hypothetical protein
MARKPKSKKRTPPAYRAASALRALLLHDSVPQVFVLGILVFTCVIGFSRLERHAISQPYFQIPPRLEFTDVPDVLRDHVEDSLYQTITAVTGLRWSDPDLCRLVHEVVAQNPWVKSVNSVQRSSGGVVEISCRFHLPAALVQQGEQMLLVTADAFLLPGTFRYERGWILIQGVASPPPSPGQLWDAPDLMAGLELAESIGTAGFGHQIVGVSVFNFGGREDIRESHLELATDRTGGRIFWGSAIGHEIEENNLIQKLAILEANYQTTGRVDAGYPVIDISTFPDRFEVPSGYNDR